jgi:hypothetical protein
MRGPLRASFCVYSRSMSVSIDQTAGPAPEDLVVNDTAAAAAKLKVPWAKRHWKALAWTAGAVLVASGAAAAGWIITRPKPSAPAVHATASASPSPSPSPSTPLTKASPLTGVQVTPEQAALPIVSIMVENQTDARPQSGLQSAGVVYEALAEGGITRFQTFFLENKPSSIGPVRSLRPYYVDWGLEFGAPVAHAGGSAAALSLAADTGLASLNALVIGSPTFFRTSDRVAPHNLYTSGSLIAALLAKRGLNGPSTFTPSPRQMDKPVANAPHPKIHIEYSYSGYQVDYAYDAATNDYARSEGGAPHIDRGTGKQIHVKNIVIEMTSVTVADSAGHMAIQTTGHGNGWVIRDGDAIPITWSKDTAKARTKLTDAAGKEVPLNAGNTWYSIVPLGKVVTF